MCARKAWASTSRRESPATEPAFDPDYGATPVDDEDAQALVPAAREALGEPLLKASLYDLEQAIEDQVIVGLRTQVYAGALGVSHLLTDDFLRDLHAQMYGDIWT